MALLHRTTKAVSVSVQRAGSSYHHGLAGSVRTASVTPKTHRRATPHQASSSLVAGGHATARCPWAHSTVRSFVGPPKNTKAYTKAHNTKPSKRTKPPPSVYPFPPEKMAEINAKEQERCAAAVRVMFDDTQWKPLRKESLYVYERRKWRVAVSEFRKAYAERHSLIEAERERLKREKAEKLAANKEENRQKALERRSERKSMFKAGRIADNSFQEQHRKVERNISQEEKDIRVSARQARLKMALDSLQQESQSWIRDEEQIDDLFEDVHRTDVEGFPDVDNHLFSEVEDLAASDNPSVEDFFLGDPDVLTPYTKREKVVMHMEELEKKNAAGTAQQNTASSSQ